MTQHRSSFEKRANSTVAFMSSFVLHVVVLLVIASLVFTAGKNSQGVLFDAPVGNTDQTGLDLVDIVAVEPEVEPQKVILPEQSVTALALADLNVSTTLNTPTADKGASIDATLTSTSSVGGGDASSASDALASTMKKNGAAFFGAYAEGKRFIFVLDSSRSMLEDDRWTYACNQLIDSLNGLQPEQEFYIICFDIKTTYLFNNPPSRAKFFTADEKTLPRVKRWLRSHELGRATMPAEALQNALALEPDAIFLLSDGELQDNSLGMLRVINGFSSTYRQIPIHTVHLFSQDGRETLRLIAQENSGTFTPVQNN